MQAGNSFQKDDQRPFPQTGPCTVLVQGRQVRITHSAFCIPKWSFMKTTLKLTASGAVLSGLAAGSTAYNHWIDRNDETEPGATSLRVALGTGYTLFGVALTVLVWRGWRDALAVLGWAILCFAISGAPMIAGDVRRGRW